MIKLILAVGAVALVILMAYAVGYTDGWERSIKYVKGAKNDYSKI